MNSRFFRFSRPASPAISSSPAPRGLRSRARPALAKPGSIRIVDDDAAMRDALAEAVRDLGHDVHLAPSGEAALRIIEHETVNGVLLDLRMPGIDGLEVLRRIRARPRPVAVTITRHSDKHD